ncbi:hypothetical protein GGI12_003870 [Dipsacomyces acuminosporus]|nr:hypothetical protein GGI12_003870 [Dipsacomyces acuminosporus]
MQLGSQSPALCSRHAHHARHARHAHTTHIRTGKTQNGKRLPNQGSAEQAREHEDPVRRFFGQRDARFMFTAIHPSQYKHVTRPEITFAGRSNVGKSSLINAVLGSRQLVKTSKKPGHTSALNFFSLTSKASPSTITLVDMPGYGFRSRDEWGEFTMDYLATRQELRRVFLLVEAKVGELKDTDKSFLELVEAYNVPTQVVLTKTDKLKTADLDRISADVVRSSIDIAPSVVQPRVIHCSSRTKTGIRNLQQEILQVCGVLDTIQKLD